MKHWQMPLLAVCIAMPAAGADVDTAAALYEGRSGIVVGTAEIGGTRFPGTRFACKGCHGRDGRGGGESGAPSIEGTSLFAPMPDRPAYDIQSLAAALSEGRTPSGRKLSAVMPRYKLSADIISGLNIYLRELPARQRRGVTDENITFAVPAPPGTETFAKTYAALVEGSLRKSLGSLRLYGRQVRVVPMIGPPDEIATRAEAQAFAVMGMPPTTQPTMEDYLDRSIPVLFPLHPLSGDEDVTLVRGLSPSWRDIAQAVSGELARQKNEVLLILTTDPDHPMLQALRRSWKGKLMLNLPAETRDNCNQPKCAALLLRQNTVDWPRSSLRTLPADIRIYLLSSEGGQAALDAAKGGRNITLILDAPAMLSTAITDNVTTIEAYASTSAAVLIDALRAAGPDPTRAALLDAIGDVVLPDYHLDYGKARLNGTSKVTFAVLSSDRWDAESGR
ncbi:hypothetical protein SAMN02982989_1136 [Xaviernesmea oryzae]|uniref:Cytochrome c domain-containing protein n=1 Tax=Xaviernesmea oryzae TaxID=464029 RepID=A0A1X7FY56_9HYPH|nr:hypothetical protein [Xaviernesmea oryzae]SMF60903.1 hypothetical protein SAMN02982989_1136 [Xaviernesmea oryzae]